jgi:hypothetical protein
MKKNWSWFVEPTDDAAKPPLARAALVVAFSGGGVTLLASPEHTAQMKVIEGT